MPPSIHQPGLNTQPKASHFKKALELILNAFEYFETTFDIFPWKSRTGKPSVCNVGIGTMTDIGKLNRSVAYVLLFHITISKVTTLALSQA